jgi:hypothetical protein
MMFVCTLQELLMQVRVFSYEQSLNILVVSQAAQRRAKLCKKRERGLNALKVQPHGRKLQTTLLFSTHLQKKQAERFYC